VCTVVQLDLDDSAVVCAIPVSEDSRLKGYNRQVTHPTLPLQRTYCANCGKPRGWVTTETYKFIEAQQIIVICDACEATLGGLPLAKVEIPEVQA
jgi:hypothetical protein